MDPQAEALAHEVDQLAGAEFRLFALCRAQRLDHFVAELVGSPGAAPVRQQRRQAACLEGELCLVPGGPRDAEARSGTADGHAVFAHTAQHLVLDLEQVARIEECVGQEQLVANRVGTRVQTAMLLEGIGLCIG